MSRWVYVVSIAFIVLVILFPAYHLLTDPQADLRDLFRLGIDLEGGTSLIYELRAPEGGQAPDARDAKRVISGRIDPQGTRGYTVRAIGKHRLEIVLPGRATRVKVDQETVTRENLAAAREAALRQNRMVADLIGDRSDAFLAGTRLVVRMKPPLYLDDIQNRLTQALRERKPSDRPLLAVVGLDPVKEQWERVAVLLGIPPSDKTRVNEWKDQIATSLATQQDVTRVKRLVRQAGFLEFRIIADRVKDRDKANFEMLVRRRQAGQPPDTPQYRWYPLKRGYEWYKEGLLDAWNYVYVVDQESQTVEVLVDVGDGQDVTGRDLARAGASSQDGDPIVVFSLKPQAGARFAKLTSPEMRNRHLAIILDGVIQSAPVLRATLSTGGIIEGYRNNIRERDEVVTILNSGQLAASLGDPITERTVGPELGADNIRKGLIASAIGLVLVLAFMATYYLFCGLVADVALLLNLVLTVCLMFLIRQTWTLPGIAGLILSLAMAVDANVLINERLREEKGREGSLAFALRKAYERAFRTILDSNLTTLIPAFILLLPGLATEEVKGFAVVMIIGILVSMFTAVVVTRMIFETLMKWGLLKQARMLQVIQAPNFRWMRAGRVVVVVAAVVAVAGAIAFYARGQDKYDIEFTGGTQVELALKVPPGQKDVPIELVRERAAAALGPATTVQELEYSYETAEGAADRFLISVPSVGQAAAGEAAVRAALAKAFADMQPDTGSTRVEARAEEITESVVRERLSAERSAATAPAASAAGGAAAAAPSEASAAAAFIPPEYRQYLGKIRILADVSPPMAPADVQRRIDTFVRDRYPDMVGTMMKVTGRTPADSPGEFKTLDVWVRQDFGGKRAETDNPLFWTDVVKLALGSEQAFASTTSFEPSMAGETWHKAVVAIVFSVIGIVVYIWIRFARLSYGVGAVVALVYDVFVTLGAVAVSAALAQTSIGRALLITDMKINLAMVGSFLTLVGYSINDKIVLFDRIRENRGKFGDLSVPLVDQSINQTITRTIWTGFTTLLVLAVMYVFAGRASTLHGFSFVLLLGIAMGTFSSIFVAIPILVLRDYLYRVYSYAYPILGVALLGYFGLVWRSPAEFFGSWPGWLWTVLQLGWVALATWAVRCDAYGLSWPLAARAPGLVRAMAGIGLVAPLAAAGLLVAMLVAPTEANWAAWAGPAAVGALATVPVSYALYRMVWGRPAEKH